ncbi:MAG TPA: hypothetical protein V6C72_18105, partial [Chroococcales cyanobacterium]
DGGCALVLGILEAAGQTFTEEIVVDAAVPSCLPALKGLFSQEPTALRVRALRELTAWMIENYPELQRSLDDLPAESELQAILQEIESADLIGMLTDAVEKHRDEHAIRLIRELRLKSMAPRLIALASQPEAANLNVGTTDQLIETLGVLGDLAAVEPLIKLARARVDINQRTDKTPSKHPVAEENQPETKTYWRVLQALGHLPTPDSISLLIECTRDHAPDKREQALSSLISCAAVCRQERPAEIKDAVATGLADPSPQVCIAALNGVAKLGLLDFVDSAITLVNSKQTAINKQAVRTVLDLAEQGHKKQVSEALQKRIARESDHFRKQKLTELLTSL